VSTVTVIYVLHHDPEVIHTHHKGDVTFGKDYHCDSRQEAEALAAELTRDTIRCTVTAVVSDEPAPADEDEARLRRRLRRLPVGNSDTGNEGY
jgi:hypothetical protein